MGFRTGEIRHIVPREMGGYLRAIEDWEDIPETLPLNEGKPRSQGHVVLTVFGDAGMCALPLPDKGRIRIGRAPTNEVHLDDAASSREHAVLHIGPTIRLEDLASVNGTRIDDERLVPHEPVEIRVGQVFSIGSTLLSLQRTSIGARKITTWSRDYLEVRLKEECQRRAGDDAPLGVVQIRLEHPSDSVVLEEQLSQLVRSSDVVALDENGVYIVLVLDVDAERTRHLAMRVRERLNDADLAAYVTCAAFPDDGRSAEALLAPKVSESARKPAPRGTSFVIGDQKMMDLYGLIDDVAKGTIAVLIQGETGVGKENIAESIHKRSQRSAGPFLRLNCAALTESLAESELFGHEKGAFTGAEQSKPGLLESASGGTVFLDEIGELPLALQAKLLRVIENQQVIRVGSLTPRPIDVRFVAATNRDLDEEVAAGRFRRDLFFRLGGTRIHVPPLRERISEVDPLAEVFIDKTCRALGRAKRPALTKDARAKLLRYQWPGNIRELRNAIEHAVLVAKEDEIRPEHLAAIGIGPCVQTPLGVAEPRPQPLDPEDAERKRILDKLAEAGGNQTKAAQLLGISRRTLTNRLNQLGLPRPKKKLR